MFKPVLLVLAVLTACTVRGEVKSQPSGVSTDTSVTDTASFGPAVDSLPASIEVVKPSIDAASMAVTTKVEKLCLLLQMPNGKIRLLSQEAGIKQCETIYKSLPDSVKPTSPSDHYTYKSGGFVAIQLKDWKKGWSPGKDTTSRRVELY